MSLKPAALAAPAVPVLAVVGVGLIGGSFAAALRRAGQVGHILGVSRRQGTLDQALHLGLIDEAASPEQAGADADLILLAIPVCAMNAVFPALRDTLRPGAIVTDAGSTKCDVIAAARAALGERIGQFVPGHPVAGSEAAGPSAADPDLYLGRKVILTPLAENDAASIARVSAAWQHCGAQVQCMPADQHDAVLGSVSHMPHWLASLYMLQVAQAADADMRLALAGSGFRDFTRIAAGSAEVWRDIFLSNRAAMLDELRVLRGVLDQAERALQAQDGDTLYALLDQAAVARRAWRSINQE